MAKRGAPKGNQYRKNKTLPKLTCVNCGKTKTAGRFPKRGGPTYEQYPASDPRRYDTQCKLCKKPAMPGQKREELKEPVRPMKKPAKKRKRKSKAKAKVAAAAYKQRVRAETRVKSMLYLAEKGCQECGERDPRKLEYDHKEPRDKKRVIARLIVDGYSWGSRVLRAEIRKCRVLCANCHRMHTVEQQGYYAAPEIQQTLRDLADEHGFDL